MMKIIRKAAVKFAVLLLGLILLAGCSSPSGSSTSSPDREVDVVVVGSGISGFMAALSAKDTDPNLTVLLIEKEAIVGGTTNRAGGGFNATILGAAAAGASSAKTAWAALTDPASDPSQNTGYPDLDKYWAVAQHAQTARAYMTDTSVLNLATGPLGGAALITALKGKAEEKGITILTGCKATSIVMESGAAAGVRAT